MKNEKENKLVIGVLGGMGTYATIHLFRQYAELFPAEKEWDRPRILIDNNCTMPSRVRACLYGEKTEELVSEMTASLRLLIEGGANRILLACNTSHLFLPKVYERLPEAEKFVVNIIDACVEELKKSGTERIWLLATEGTILSGVYQQKLENEGIVCECPSESEFEDLRLCIEAVKQNCYTEEVKSVFSQFLERAGERACILGCTELPVLYDHYPELRRPGVFDPLRIALERIKGEI